MFSGDKSPLWRAWTTAVLAIDDPFDDPKATDEAPAVVKVKGRGKAPKKRAKKASKKAGKPTPYRQRTAAQRLTLLWMVHLREQLRGGEGLPSIPPVQGSSGRLARQLAHVLTLRDSIQFNPNVRLALEQTLLEVIG